MLFQAVVIGTSLGGMNALKTILSRLPKNFPIPILIVQHLSPYSDGFLAKYLDNLCEIEVIEAEEKMKILQGHAYIAPPNYHMLVDKNGFLSFTIGEKVNYARPSIDILFESSVDAYGDRVIGILLTGANADGSRGLKRIKEVGGLTIVQDPIEAEADAMPRAAINISKVDYVLPLYEIAILLNQLIGCER